MDSSRNSITRTVVDDHADEDSYIEKEQTRGELGHRMAEDEAQAPTGPRKFQHGFWDSEVAHLRKIYFKILGMTVVLLVVAMWLFFSIYWGSLGETAQHVPNLKGYVINRDGSAGEGLLGQAIVAAFEANSRGEGVPEKQHLTWTVVDSSYLPSNEDVAYAVVEEEVWAAVVVNFDATSLLTSARSSGNSSYDPRDAVTFYYNQGRNEIAANSFIVPYTTALLQSTLSAFNARTDSQYFAALANSADGAKQEAMVAISRAPQTVSQPFSYEAVNLRPYTKTASQAVLLVGQIYIIILSFVITMTHDFARGIISPFLRFNSYARMRLLVPLVIYIPLSFSYAMVNLPFKITFDAKYTYAGGFFLFWVFVYMGMAALGLATEAMITLLTPRFIAYFLIALIISNVSVASVPIVLQPSFYQYGYGFPVFNLAQAVRTIIFNTKNHLGLNAGVLLAWVALSMITVPLFTWLMRRKDEQAEKQKNAEQKVVV
ncbi:hypothetical protein M407DRAFT_176434 [Tulasnella calospora MUT 4182]|uniref:DUF3533 domain-containing protein n=1 Tax=Tulasnella calospora MUT 4182 TaxID=1051891 RepID=A0A0C3QD23_9AGAM|nr:hypothetical protein M407DRAFT_176434 [Tulasnella calospora MUT 4182]